MCKMSEFYNLPKLVNILGSNLMVWIKSEYIYILI